MLWLPRVTCPDPAVQVGHLQKSHGQQQGRLSGKRTGVPLAPGRSEAILTCLLDYGSLQQWGSQQ